MSEEKIEVKIGTEREKLFTDLKTKTENTIKSINNELIIQKAVIKMCDAEIKAEQVPK